MTYLQLAYLHLATVLPAFILGTYLLIARKGSRPHKTAGAIYMLLMLCTAAISLLMPAKVGPTLFGHLGFIHLFSFLVIYSVPSAYFAIRNGHTVKHKKNMQGLYIGGLLIAGSFALLPGRLIHQWIFT